MRHGAAIRRTLWGLRAEPAVPRSPGVRDPAGRRACSRDRNRMGHVRPGPGRPPAPVTLRARGLRSPDAPRRSRPAWWAGSRRSTRGAASSPGSATGAPASGGSCLSCRGSATGRMSSRLAGARSTRCPVARSACTFAPARPRPARRRALLRRIPRGASGAEAVTAATRADGRAPTFA